MRWSPDGRWLSFRAWTDTPDEHGLWIITADGEDALFLMDNGQAHWSPDGRYFVSQHIGPLFSNPGQSITSLVEAETWHVSQIDLPADAQILTWNPITP